MTRIEQPGKPRGVLWRAAELMLGPWADEVLGDLLERPSPRTGGRLSRWRLGADAFVLALQIRFRLRPPRPASSQVRDRGRHTGWLAVTTEELRYALRRLRRSPMFALLSSLTIAVGVAGAVAVLTVVAVAVVTLTLAAGLVPALRASRTSPSSVLDRL